MPTHHNLYEKRILVYILVTQKAMVELRVGIIIRLSVNTEPA